MMEKLAQAGDGGECTLTYFIISTITYIVVMCTLQPRRQGSYTPLFILYPYMYSVVYVKKLAIPLKW